MEKRQLYEHQELDLDNEYYWVTNADVEYPYKVKELEEFCKWWKNHEVNTGLYYKGTRLYFTFRGAKYYLSWTFTSGIDFDTAIAKLKELKASNIQINWGELD